MPNGKHYIGITKNLKERFYGNGNSYRNCTLFYKAIMKYGWENIRTEILATGLRQEEAELKEIEFIAKYKSNNREQGYNLLKGGNISKNNSKGRRDKISKSLYKYWNCHKISQDTVEKIRQKRIGVKFTDDHKQKLKDNHKGMMGKHHSTNTRNKISLSHKNKPLTPEHRKSLSNAKKGKVPTIAINATKKPVIQYNKDGFVINTFKSIMQAERETKIFNTSISACCNGKRKTAGGYIWKHLKIN
jgi:group I intron endonuclease